jgi:hypothetical protein
MVCCVNILRSSAATNLGEQAKRHELRGLVEARPCRSCFASTAAGLLMLPRSRTFSDLSVILNPFPEYAGMCCQKQAASCCQVWLGCSGSAAAGPNVTWGKGRTATVGCESLQEIGQWFVSHFKAGRETWVRHRARSCPLTTQA